jgi:hypothetical protein
MRLSACSGAWRWARRAECEPLRHLEIEDTMKASAPLAPLCAIVFKKMPPSSGFHDPPPPTRAVLVLGATLQRLLLQEIELQSGARFALAGILAPANPKML